ncbi:MAG TPA: GAF domain-containing SpoIIE family protein phosphatase [Terriglobales bacterium]|jgi:sigma-B regulation protein RsbU (phosphoserine phosphatase)|nr:GAF domain-containing SpoIIE family protein phosphatase [Terriglobales bacterium]
MASPSPVPAVQAPAVFQQRRVDALVCLQKAAQQIGSILELDELLDTIVHRIAVDFGCIESGILLVEGDQFHLAAVHGCTQAKKGARFPVTEGLSGQVVATGTTYYAPDVTQELLYRACEPDTRSEVIIPLKVGDRIIGVFDASHHDVNAFPRGQIEILKALAAHIAVAVDNAQRIQRERRQMERVHEEHDEARRIQQNLLPRSAPALSGFQLEAECVPAGAVGGDWFDYIPLADGRWALVLADVSGKGVPAALLMSATRGIVRSLAPLASGPGEVLQRVNQMLVDDFPTGRYVTMIYAVLDPARRTLTFASAGHPWPLLCHGTDVRPLHTDAGMPLGLLPCEFTEHTVTFCHDFRLLFYTDGISEALNREEQEFGSGRLMEFVAAHDCSVSRLMQDIEEFSGRATPTDDATVILLRSA